MEPYVTNRYVYGPYGEPMHYDNDQERQGFIGKERDLESNLADHGVRKYDYMTGRFTSLDPLWEKYLGLTPWQYAGNNPVNWLDENGKWVAELSQESHRHNGSVSKNSNGYLANKVNNEFYNKWKTIAPAVADFVAKNNLFVIQTDLDGNDYGEGEVSGNLSMYDLTKKGAYAKIEGTVLHEIIHNMGHGEFGAWSAMLAAGYNVEEQIRYRLASGNPDLQGYIFDINDVKSIEIWTKYINGDLSIDDVITSMKDYGKTIIQGVGNDISQ